MSEFWFSNLFYTEYTLSTSDTPHNIRTQTIANGWNGSDPVHVKVTVSGNRGSTSTGTPAIQTGTPFPSGSIIELVNNAIISGRGGNGGSANSGSGLGGGQGMVLNYPITIDNNGTIQGGGVGGNAGGGGSSSGGENQPPIYYTGGGGGGGAGYPGGSGGSPNGSAGSISAGGSGGGGYGGGAGSGSSGGAPGHGYAIATNSNTITWQTAGTTHGTVG